IPDPGFVGTVIVHALANSNGFTIESEFYKENSSRLDFVDCLQSILDICHVTKSRFGAASVRVEQLTLALDKYNSYVENIKDKRFIEDEIIIACNSISDWDRWGAHYVRSLCMAHSNRECNNFKDPSVQLFEKIRGCRWLAVRDKAHNLFIELPVPLPSSKKRKYNSNYYVSSSSSCPPPTMVTYSNIDNGCMHENALVQLYNGKFLECKNISKGMIVKTYDPLTKIYGNDLVECVIKTKCGIGRFTRLENKNFKSTLNITGWHPIIKENKWIYPSTIAPSVKLKSEYVYSFLLGSRQPSMIIGGYPCITLAANCKDQVAYHDFWGTEKVVESIKKINGYKQGEIIISKDWVRRDTSGSVYDISEDIITSD
ncbi:MAG TPA: hypothetical protein EYO58_13350, partial [Flavobacteriales bacterium]|nr:hypothetical protein [Flavobacteriales bacterium]